MQRSFLPFIIGVVAFLAVVITVFVLYISSSSSLSYDKDIFNLKLTLWCGILFSGIAYVGWEAEYGSAFSYYLPMHGSKRVQRKQWEVGIFIRSTFVAMVLAQVFAFTAVSSAEKEAAHRQLSVSREDERKFMSHLNFGDALLVPVTCAFPLLALLIYTLIDNHRKPNKKTNLP